MYDVGIDVFVATPSPNEVSLRWVFFVELFSRMTSER